MKWFEKITTDSMRKDKVKGFGVYKVFCECKKNQLGV